VILWKKSPQIRGTEADKDPLMSYLSAVDAAFLRIESPRTPMHVGGLMVFRRPPDAPPDYLRRLHEQLRTTPVSTYPFNSRIKEGTLHGLRPRWEVVDNIDIDYHVRHSALPYPGGERELGVLVARLHSHPLDMTRPLWEFHLIEGLENNRFAFYLKAHHCAIDGMGAMKIIKRWLSDDPLAHTSSAPWSLTIPRQKRSKQEEGSTFRKVVDFVKKQTTASSQLVQTLKHMADPAENPEGGARSALQTPHSLFNLHITQQRRLATQLYDMERFKRLSEATGTTINDLSLAIIGTASRRYLAEINALPDHSLIASVPVGVPRPDGRPGNAAAGFVCPLFTEQEDVLYRLNTIKKITARTKVYMKSLSMDAINQFAMLGLAPLIFAQMTGLGTKIPPFFNFVVSNVVASRSKLYLNGAELEAMYPISILFDGYALNVTIVGYADRIAVGFTGCRDAIPSLQRLAVYTGDALADLERRVFGEMAGR
jgi:diacylglycerol O-acyltransferase